MKTRKVALWMMAVPAFAVAAAPSALAQTWSGWARCVIDIQGAGYKNTETHTWVVTGATSAGSSGTWTSSGAGTLDQGNPQSQSMHAEWTINASGVTVNTPRFRADVTNGVVSIRPLHSQSRLTGGIQGFVQQTIGNVARTPSPISATQYEWAFPTVQAPASNPTFSGSSTTSPAIGWGVMRPSGAALTSTCNWQFASDGSQPMPPSLADELREFMRKRKESEEFQQRLDSKFPRSR